MSDDEIPDPIAAMDQLIRGLLDVAKPIRAYHLALLEQGFTDAEALQLTMGFQHTVITLGSNQ